MTDPARLSTLRLITTPQAVTARYDVEYAEHLRIMTTMYTEFLLAMLQVGR